MRIGSRMLLVVVMGAAAAAAAQPAAPSGQAAALDAAQVRQRVIAELATSGVSLARLGLVLELEAVGDVVVVSLVDPRSQATVASTKVDRVPKTLDGAVAVLTPAVAALAEQVEGKAPAATPRPDEPGSDDRREDHLREIEELQRRMLEEQATERREREQREQAEATYAAQAIRFNNVVALTLTGDYQSVGRHWFATQGPGGTPLDAPDYYRMVGRDDLARSYRRRRRVWIGGLVLTCTAPAAGGLLLALFDGDNPEAWIIGAGVVSLAAFSVSTWYYFHMHPVSEREAKRLGAEYNRKLRVRLGLPVASAAVIAPVRPRPPTLTPYASEGGGGLVLSGQF